MFSKSCEYGLRATIYIAQQTSLEKKVNIDAIAQEINSPKPFTSKVLQTLTKHKLISAIKGPYGGFYIEKDKFENLKLSEIVTAIDGNKVFTDCGLGLKQCNSEAPCPLHHKFVATRNELKKMLETTTIKSIANNMNNKHYWLKR